MKSSLKVLAAAIVTAFATAAAAQTTDPFVAPVSALDKVGANRGQTQVATKIASNFTGLAGSEENALALVNALRTGETVQLTYAPTGTGTTPTVATYDPPTGKMGWGNVKIALALAADQLARAGITNPTAEQLTLALNGGDLVVTNADGTTTTTALRGVLQMRADGMGWGQIAQAGGTKVGPVVSQLKMANQKVAAIPPTTAEGTTAATTVKTKGVTTTVGKGVVTGDGATTTTTRTTGPGNSSKGLTTAAGVANTNSSRGLTTATGATTTSHGQGHAYGRGVTTPVGGGAVQVSHGRSGGAGAGVVTAGGGGSTHGNAGGNGKGNAGGNGKGKGG